MSYHAFISYSHLADARIAPVLQRALERLGTPWWRRANVRIFRDDSSLPASSALWAAIEAGLEQSQHFVLLASPTSATSTWVEQEVRWWIANRNAATLLIVVTGGDIIYDPAKRDFDWDRTNCLPKALKGVFTVEPLWTDMRFVKSPDHLTMRHSRFRSSALGLAAAIRGVAKDDLESEDIRQHRRSRAVAAGTVGGLAVLVLATVAAIWVARSESANARHSRLESDSRRLAAEAMAQLDGGRGIAGATLKAAIAWRLSPTDDARRALQHIDQATPDIARILGQHTGQTLKLAFSRDNRRLVTIGKEGLVLQWSLKDGRATGLSLASEHQWVSQLRFSRDGSHLLVHGTRDDKDRSLALTVFRMNDGVKVSVGTDWMRTLKGAVKSTIGSCAAISPAASRVAVAAGDAFVVIENANGATVLHRVGSGFEIAALGLMDEKTAVFIAVDTRGRGVGFAGRLDLVTGDVTRGAQIALTRSRCDFAYFSDDGSRVAMWTSRHLALLQIDQQLKLSPLPTPSPSPSLVELTGHHAPELDAGGKRVAYGIGGIGYVWEPDTRQMLKTTSPLGNGHGPALALSADGHKLAALDRATPIIWDIEGNSESRRVEILACEGSVSEDACINRLCDRLTGSVDEKRWRELLGVSYSSLVKALKGTTCSPFLA